MLPLILSVILMAGLTPWFKADVDLDGQKDQFYYKGYLSPGVNRERLSAKVDPLVDIEIYAKVGRKIELLGKIRQVEKLRAFDELLITKGERKRKIICLEATVGRNVQYWGVMIDPSPRLIHLPPELILNG